MDQPLQPPPPGLTEALAAILPAGATWTPLAGGRSNHVWRVGDLVCKLARPRRPAPLFPNDPAAERIALAALADTGLAPRLVAEIPFADTTCLVYRHVEGRPFGPADDPAEAARTLGRLHALTPPAGLRRLPGTAAAIIEETRALGGPAASGPDLPDRTAFLHGDPVPANLIASPAGPILIDWQNAAIGHPAHDLAILLSPAMQHLYGGRPLSDDEEAATLAAYPDPAVTEEYRAAAPLLHARLAAYADWRARHGEPAYARAEALERARLARL